MVNRCQEVVKVTLELIGVVWLSYEVIALRRSVPLPTYKTTGKLDDAVVKPESAFA